MNKQAKTEFTTSEFEANFDELFARVENGETLTIIHKDGLKVVITPIDSDLAPLFMN